MNILAIWSKEAIRSGVDPWVEEITLNLLNLTLSNGSRALPGVVPLMETFRGAPLNVAV